MFIYCYLAPDILSFDAVIPYPLLMGRAFLGSTKKPKGFEPPNNVLMGKGSLSAHAAIGAIGSNSVNKRDVA